MPMAMDETVTYGLSIATSITAVSGLALIVYKVWCSLSYINTGSSTPLGTKSQSTGTSVCESETCIRCSKNKEILVTALTRLTYYIAPRKSKSAEDYLDLDKGSSEMNDVDLITSDVKMSLKFLKERETKNPIEMEARKTDSLTSTPLVLKLSGILERKIWYLNDFPALNLLEKNFTQIYLEFMHLYQSTLTETTSFWKVNDTSAGKWEIVLLVDQGRRTKASEFCPLTMGLLDQIPYFMNGNLFGNASFSVVHPGTDITAHYGSTNCRIRCHLGLKVPKDPEDCTLWVDGVSLHWEEGKSIFFNDAFLHSVHHRGPPSSGYRAVLMIDLWHPDTSEIQRKVLDYAFSS